MSIKLKITQNNKKIGSLNLQKMKKALAFSKKDTNQYFLKLSSILDNHNNDMVQSQAWKYLTKLHKLQIILNDLITQLQTLITQWNLQISSNKLSYIKVIQKMDQLEKEIRIFNEIHFNVKRTYIQFTNEYFKENWKKSLKVA